MKKMVELARKRLACKCHVDEGILTLTPYNVTYNVMFEIGKHNGWFSLWENDGKWYLLGELKTPEAVINRLLKEHGGLAL